MSALSSFTAPSGWAGRCIRTAQRYGRLRMSRGDRVRGVFVLRCCNRASPPAICSVLQTAPKCFGSPLCRVSRGSRSTPFVVTWSSPLKPPRASLHIHYRCLAMCETRKTRVEIAIEGIRDLKIVASQNYILVFRSVFAIFATHNGTFGPKMRATASATRGTPVTEKPIRRRRLSTRISPRFAVGRSRARGRSGSVPSNTSRGLASTR